MFLFPWLDWGDDISDFEKIDFLADGRFWGVPSPWEGWFLALASSDTCIHGQKIFKKCGMKKIFWKIFRKTSKLSRNIFWACWDHIVAQKSLASKKMPKTTKLMYPPPCLPYCVIWSQHAQNIFLESLEVFLKIFKKFFSYHTFWKFSAHGCKCR